jgi:hypothetical protein
LLDYKNKKNYCQMFLLENSYSIKKNNKGLF